MTLGRILIIAGVLLAGAGVLIEAVPFLRLGRLPGDLSFGGHGWRVYIPIGTSILLSIIITVIFAVFGFLGARK